MLSIAKHDTLSARFTFKQTTKETKTMNNRQLWNSWTANRSRVIAECNSYAKDNRHDLAIYNILTYLIVNRYSIAIQKLWVRRYLILAGVNPVLTHHWLWSVRDELLNPSKYEV